MRKTDMKLIDISEKDIVTMMNDTSKLVAKINAAELSSSAIAAQSSNSLTNDVEFWKWMGRNYRNSGIFNNNQTMQQYIGESIGKQEWMIKQLQGKGYEWDWMTSQRGNIKNILNIYDAGDVANRAASDVTKTNLLSGKTSESQMKAYISNANPHLKNTPKNMTVVTNIEKVEGVKSMGYEDVQGFQDKNIIKKSTNEHLNQINNGKAYTSYNLENVAGTMIKAGVIGCAIGVGTETIFSYKSWKRGELTDEEYFKKILISGGNAGIIAGATSSIMIPVSAAIATAGASTLLTIPVSFIVSNVINKIVAPCFGRGKYKEILSSAKYYQNLENIYDDLIISMEYASNQYYDFVMHINKQNIIHEEIKKQSKEVNKRLKDLYDSI